jgi:hypothetical protein
LINAELYGLLLAPRLKKKDTMEFGKPICNNPLGRYLAFISNLRPNNKPKMFKIGPQVLSALTPSVKWA